MRSAGTEMLRKTPGGITSGDSGVGDFHRHLHDPVWNRAVDAAVYGRYVQTGICRSGCKGTVGRIYVNMMIAWYFATALAKQWDTVIPYLEERKLDRWVHQKTIQKAVESFRITPEQKVYLKSLRYPRK